MQTFWKRQNYPQNHMTEGIETDIFKISFWT